jgi:hypothetical protein
MLKDIQLAGGWKAWLYRQTFGEKLDNPLGYMTLAAFGLSYGVMVPMLGIQGSMMIIAGLFGVPMLLLCMFNQQFGVCFTLLIAFFVNFFSKINNAPLGTSLDGLLLLMCFGIFIGQVMRRDWGFIRDPISSWLMIWMYYCFVQGLNPSAESKAAWALSVRAVAVLNLVYFIAAYAMNTYAKVKFMMKWLLFLAIITCLYAFKQEYGGFSDAEMAWLTSDPERFQLFFQWGRMRVFSIFSDPMTFGIMMTYMGIFCFIMASVEKYTKERRILLCVIGAAMIWTTAYTGTRTCYALIPIALAFYAAMTLSPRIIIGGVAIMAILTVLVIKGSSNPMIFRIQSAFKPSEDASVQIRYYNQQRIRPYIYSHPIGFGLGSTGLWARRFTPDSFLAKFAHDSYYVRIAVEGGWFGLIIYMIFMFVCVRRTLHFYLRVRDPEIKAILLSLLVAIFLLAVANYPQEAIVQLPTSMVFHVMLAIVVRIKDFDEHYQEMERLLRAKREL